MTCTNLFKGLALVRLNYTNITQNVGSSFSVERFSGTLPQRRFYEISGKMAERHFSEIINYNRCIWNFVCFYWLKNYVPHHCKFLVLCRVTISELLQAIYQYTRWCIVTVLNCNIMGEYTVQFTQYFQVEYTLYVEKVSIIYFTAWTI